MNESISSAWIVQKTTMEGKLSDVNKRLDDQKENLAEAIVKRESSLFAGKNPTQFHEEIIAPIIGQIQNLQKEKEEIEYQLGNITKSFEAYNTNDGYQKGLDSEIASYLRRL